MGTRSQCPKSGERMPAADQACGPVEQTFHQRMNLTWRESVALMGVHTLGKCSKTFLRPNMAWLSSGQFALTNRPETFSAADGWVTFSAQRQLYVEKENSMPVCDSNMVWKQCENCLATCEEPKPICPRVCQPGCGCPKKTLWSDKLNKCVRKKKCAKLLSGGRRLQAEPFHV